MILKPFTTQLKDFCFKFFLVLVILISQITTSVSQTIGIFYDQKVPQHRFAADDIKVVLEDKGFIIENLDISSLTENYKNAKVVIAVKSNKQVAGLLGADNNQSLSELGEQAYAFRTTGSPDLSYWVIGGDVNGAMYGGLQIAENISFNSLEATYNEEDSPYLKNRGIKFNI
ncbi:MAG: hypothetical protein ABR597_14725, partial [Bacteroidales bacterium]